jgi:hypothetical protein
MVVLRRWLAAILPAAAVLLHDAPAEACACCSEPGERVESSAPFGGYDADEIARVRFASAANLYTTAAGLEGIRGIADPTSRYDLSVAFDGKTFTLSFKSKDGKSGTIALSPKSVESFFVDLRSGKRGAEPLLYKEWRMSAPMLATGIFSPAVASPSAPPMAKLVLQGRGNSCTDAGQFTHWTLIVTGKSAAFTFFGDLRAPSP